MGYRPPLTMSEQLIHSGDKKSLAKVIMAMPQEKALHILNDALKVMEMIGGKKVSSSDISELVKVAKKIGDIATAYNRFLRVGGHHASGFILQEPKSEPITKGERNEPDANANGGQLT
jgi:hypothetical protein